MLNGVSPSNAGCALLGHPHSASRSRAAASHPTPGRTVATRVVPAATAGVVHRWTRPAKARVRQPAIPAMGQALAHPTSPAPGQRLRPSRLRHLLQPPRPPHLQPRCPCSRQQAHGPLRPSPCRRSKPAAALRCQCESNATYCSRCGNHLFPKTMQQHRGLWLQGGRSLREPPGFGSWGPSGIQRGLQGPLQRTWCCLGQLCGLCGPLGDPQGANPRILTI